MVPPISSVVSTPIFAVRGFFWKSLAEINKNNSKFIEVNIPTHLYRKVTRDEPPSPPNRNFAKNVSGYVEIRTAARLVAKDPYRGLMLLRLLYIATPVMNYGICIALEPPLPPFVATQSVSAVLSQVGPAFIGSSARDLHDAWLRAQGEADLATTSGGHRVQALLFEVLPYATLVVLFVVAVTLLVGLVRRQLLLEAQEENVRRELSDLVAATRALRGDARDDP